MKTLVVLNPASGRGKSGRLRPRLEAILRATSLDFELVQSEFPLHTVELAGRAAREGYDTLVVAGGDGTVNEAINGLMLSQSDGYTKTALGVIGTGTGNDFAASLGIPTALEQAVEVLIRNKRRRVDIGLLKGCKHPQGRYFGNCVGIGFDAAGTVLADKLTWVRGLLAYLIAAVGTIFFYYKAPTLDIELEHGRITLPSLLVSIMNGNRIGGGFWTAPDAKPDDGLFDLCIAEEVSRQRMFTLIPHFLKGTQASQPEIAMQRARRIKITAIQGSMPVQMDGEIVGEACHELEVDLLPKKLEILVD